MRRWPTPLGLSAAPTNLPGEVDNSGAVTLIRDATLKGCTRFTIERQLTAIARLPGAWITLGRVSGKESTDITLPQNFANATPCLAASGLAERAK